MKIVTVSPKYQVVIPKDVRRMAGIKPGQKMQVISFGERIEFVPVRLAKELRGFLKGIDTSAKRNLDRL
jgi:AbrB family looped-hinge helix DNA binding protein